MPQGGDRIIETTTTILECTYTTSGTNDLVAWYKGSDTHQENIVLQAQNGVVYPTPGFTRHDIQDQASLVITDTQLSDAGMYWCKVTAFGDGEDEKSITFTVTAQTEPSQPTISFTEGSQTSNEGSKIVMKCTSTGVPTPTITWLRNNQPLTTLSRYQLNNAKTKLTINPSHREDNDIKFTCHVTNAKASKTEDITLNIRFQTESMTLSGITNPVKEGETKILTCTTSTSNPASQISWLKDNNVWTDNTYESITSDVTRDGDYNGKISEQQMTIFIQAEHNSKSYHCQSSHIDFTGHVTSTVIHLTVYYKPFVVNVSHNQRSYASKGSVAELRCEIESNPLSSVIWYGPNNQPINKDSRVSIRTVLRGTLHESILTIQNTMLSDYGSYSCFVENDIGNTTFIVTFNDESVPDAPTSIIPITRYYDSLSVVIIPGYKGGDTNTTYFIAISFMDKRIVRRIEHW
ncbi:cell adhesion molecule CEACAM6-like [Saccoglossus kowalevskii]